MMNSPKVFIVVLNWNLKDHTVSCVESILANTYENYRILIVDNGSDDGSVEIFASRFADQVDVICNQENYGFARGMNIGIQYSLAHGAEWVLLLNNDVILESDMLSNLMEVATSASNDVSILGPAIYYHKNPDRIWRLGDVQVSWLPVPIGVKRLQRYRNYVASQQPFQVDYITGCAMLIRREVFRNVGLLDERYFMYFEDADLCARAQESGIEVLCVPSAKLFHKISLTASRDKSYNRYHRFSNQVRFYHEHTRGILILVLQIYLVFNFVKTLFVDVLNRDFDLIIPSLRALLVGYQEQLNRFLSR